MPPRSLRSSLPSHKIDDSGKSLPRDMCMSRGSRTSLELIPYSDYLLMGSHGHRITLPDITTISENTSDGSGLPIHERRRAPTQDFLSPDANYNVHKCVDLSSPVEQKKEKEGVRRAASFTFSPKGAADKTNRRVHAHPEEENKRRFLYVFALMIDEFAE
ncbi:hypothetical protein COOONC_02215, partial [Cooperia oncophora]